MAYCGKCGNKLEDDAKFCPKCGAPVDDVKDVEDQEETKNEKVIVIFAITIIFILGSIFLYNSQKADWIKKQAKIEESCLNSDAVMETNEGIERQSGPDCNGYEAIDLGLSVYWAAWNIGASSLNVNGYYFSWGETILKSTFAKSTYKYYDGNDFENIGKNISNTEYDAAHIKWGGAWRMPTKNEFEELIKKCTWSWTTIDGVKGYNVLGTNGNSIFLPATGQVRNNEKHWLGERGYYWTSTVGNSSGYAYYLVFAPYVANGVLGTESDNGWDFRYWGYVIRPVISK